MVELNDLKSGLHNLFGDIDYNRVAQSNIYYRTLLNKAEMPKPDFCRDIDDEELTATMRSTPADKLPTVAQNYLRFRRLTAPENKTPREQLLVKMRGYVSAFPNDSNLQLAFGIALIKRGFYQDSVRFLQTSVNMQPKNSVAWSLLALMAALSNDYGNAVLCSREALQQGDHYYNTQSKAFVFSRLTMSLPAKVGPFNSRLLFDNKRFDPSQVAGKIPPVSMELEPESAASTPVIFVACNEDYFDRFAKNLLLSLLEVGNSFAVHLHVVNPSANAIEWMKQYRQHFEGDVYFSREDVEDPTLAKNTTYLASNRFIHAPDFIEKHGRDYLILDADSILNNTRGLLKFAKAAKTPVLYFDSEGAIWDKISAPFAFFPKSDAGLAFARESASYLARVFYGGENPGFWYVDQLALLGCFVKNSENVSLCPSRLCSDIDCGESAMFWTLSNDKQHKAYVKRTKQILKSAPAIK